MLGLNSNSKREEFLFEFQNLVNQTNELTCIKRNVLKVGASVFEPFGLLLFKNVCKTKSGWVEYLVKPLYNKWKKINYSLKSLTFSIPRCVFN